MCCEYLPSSVSRSATASRPAICQSHRAHPARTTARTSPARSIISDLVTRAVPAVGACAITTVPTSAASQTAITTSPMNVGGNKLADLVERRHAVQRAEARAADRGRGIRCSQRLVDRLTLDQRVDESAAEDVAGAGRVERVHFERRLVIEAIA